MPAAEGADGTLSYRVDRIEQEQQLQRERTHSVAAEHGALRLLVQHTTDEVEHLGEDVRALKRAFYTFAIGTVGSAVVFAFTVFALLGKP